MTHRDHVSSLHIITGHAKKYENPEINYDALVRTGGTLVFMMSLAAVGDICSGCISAGMDENTPAAIVEKATTNEQRKFLGTVGTLPGIARDNTIKSPAVIIIGSVCLLSGRLDWFSRRPLSGKRIIVARASPGTSRLSDRLWDLGCNVIDLPCAKIVPLTTPSSDIACALKRIGAYMWLVFTSSVGVNVFFDYLTETGFDIRLLHALKIACVGTETEKEIRKRGIMVDYRPDKFSGAALARGLLEQVKSGERLLIARAKDGAEELTKILSDAGVAFDDVKIYEKKPVIVTAEDFETEFAAFTSSSAVEGFAKVAKTVDFSTIKAICIGERTAATARFYGMSVYTSDESTIDSMVTKIKEICV